MEIRGVSQGGQTTINSQTISTQTTYVDPSVNANEQMMIDASMARRSVVQSEASNSSESDFMGNDKNRNQVEKKKLDRAMDKLNKFLEDEHIKTEYSTHSKFKNSIMIKIVNEDTHEVLLEVPPKKILDMVAKMCELVGVLVDERA